MSDIEIVAKEGAGTSTANPIQPDTDADKWRKVGETETTMAIEVLS